MTWRKYCLFSLVMFISSSCTYSVHQVPISGFSPYGGESAGKPIESHSKQFVIMGFVDEAQYADQAYLNLQTQCKDGVVTGIATKFYTEHGFFSWTNHIVMQGQCVHR